MKSLTRSTTPTLGSLHVPSFVKAAFAGRVVRRHVLGVSVRVLDLPEHRGYQPLASATDDAIELDRQSLADLSLGQVEQLALHEAAHVMLRRRFLSCEDVGCIDPRVHVHEGCDCWRDSTGHCLHWRRIGREIGYVDAFTFAPPDEERDCMGRRARFLKQTGAILFSPDHLRDSAPSR